MIEFICSECKERTNDEEPCCNVGSELSDEDFEANLADQANDEDRDLFHD